MSGKGENILMAALDERWEAYRGQFKTCLREFSEEAVHDLRVAARRLLAVLDIVREVVPQPYVQKTRRLLKDQLDELDELRDVQVMLVEVLEALPSLPQLEIFQPYLDRREKSLMRLAHQRTKLSRLFALKKGVERIRSTLMQQAKDVSSPSALLQAVDRAYAKAWRAYIEIDARKLATIHQARIAFKKFRYMAEVISPLLPSHDRDYLRCLHDYQSAMGDIRDTDILLDGLTDFARATESASIAIPIRRHFRKDLRQLVSIFMKEKGDLESFWRPAPSQPFPWETSHHSRKTLASLRVRRRRSTESQDPVPAESKPAVKAPSHDPGPAPIQDNQGPPAATPPDEGEWIPRSTGSASQE